MGIHVAINGVIYGEIIKKLPLGITEGFLRKILAELLTNSQLNFCRRDFLKSS